jgi:hypothetical protein
MAFFLLWLLELIDPFFVDGECTIDKRTPLFV